MLSTPRARTRASTYSAGTSTQREQPARRRDSFSAYSPRIPDPYYAHRKTRLEPDAPPPKRRPSLRKRPSFFTPAEIPSIAPSCITTPLKLTKPTKLPKLSFIDLAPSPPPYSVLPPAPPPPMSDSDSDTEIDDDVVDDAIYTSSSLRPQQSSSSSSLRRRIFGSVSSSSSDIPKPICTTPGRLCAGETETETDEPPRLPTSRIIPLSLSTSPSPSSPLEKLTPLLFEFSRFLSIVPAVVGTLYNLYHIIQPPSTPRAPERVDYFISLLWSILTGYQCLSLATGLLFRWRAYYPPLSTLVRLLALQGICWPATQLTLTLFEHERRPVITWAVIGTTTSISRSVQLWVTSNLWWDTRHQGREGEGRKSYWRRLGGGGKWGGRRWDWKEVGVKCVLPAGVVYFVMAWAEQLRREFSSGC